MFCRKCGNRVAEDTKFCQNCGAELKSADETEKLLPALNFTDTQEADDSTDEEVLMTKRERLVMCLMAPFVMIPIITVVMIFDEDTDVSAGWIAVNVLFIVIAVSILLVVRNMVNKRIEEKK